MCDLICDVISSLIEAVIPMESMHMYDKNYNWTPENVEIKEFYTNLHLTDGLGMESTAGQAK